MRALAEAAKVLLERSDGVAKKLWTLERSSSIFVNISLRNSRNASGFCLPSFTAM
jgi:hypothetical protein